MTTYTFGLRCNMTQKPMIVLTGPTAVGKTALSIELAKKINGAIISADSMQVYKYMDIGSAKVTVDEMDGIKHYLIDELEHLTSSMYLSSRIWQKKHLMRYTKQERYR